MDSNFAELEKKIAIVVTVKTTAASFVSGFARHIAQNNHHVYIIADGLDASFERVGAGSITLIPLSMRRDPSLSHDLKSLYHLFKILRSIKPQIVLYGTPKASLLSSLAASFLRIPVRIYQLWGLRMETVQGVSRGVLWLMERLTSAFSTGIIANSQSLATKYQNLGLSKVGKIFVLGEGSSHGVDLEYFSASSTSHFAYGNGENLKEQFTIGFVGRLHPDKGIDILLDAMRILRKRNIQLRLLLVGNDEGAELDFSEGIEQSVEIIGRVEDTRAYYKAMDILILPSLREGFPNVVLEAASMSVPAIVSDGTGVIDSVVDGETGLIVPVGDPYALANSIQTLYENAPLRNKMAANARFRVEKFFDQVTVWDRTLKHILNT